MSDGMEAIRESIEAVLDDRCGSLALHAFFDGEPALANDLRQQAIALGWLAVGLPEASGGFGLGAPGLALLHRALGRVAAPGDLIAQSVALDVFAGSDDPVAVDLAQAVLAGDKRIAIPARPADPMQGTLCLGDPSSDVALVVAREDVLLVDISGSSFEAGDFWDRTRTLFDLPAGAGVPIATSPCARAILENSLALALAADSAGLARGIAERTLAYMKERQQFDRPIASFQALKHRMADIFKAIDSADHLVDQAAACAAQGGAMAALWAMQAKAAATDIAAFVTGDCVQLHGGVGFTWEYDPHIYLKRARLNEMLLGTNGALRDRAFAELKRAVLDGVDVMELAL